MIKFFKVSNSFLVLVAIGVLYSLICANTLLTLLSFILLYFLYTLHWVPNETPVMFLAMVFQWLQVTTKIFEANSADMDIDLYALSTKISEATYYGMAGLLVLALGINYVINKKSDKIRVPLIWEEVDIMDVNKAFQVFIYTFIGTFMLQTLLFVVPQLTQFIISVLNLKWLTYCYLAYVVLIQRSGYLYLVTAFALELVLGSIGFYSSFKDVIFITVCCILTINANISAATTIILGILVYVAFNIFVVWTGVKGEYRDYLNTDGANSGLFERFDKINLLVNTFDESKKADAVERSFSRLAYTDMFAYCIDNIPKNIPHTDGMLFNRYVSHIFQPRVLFPNKKAIDDSELANMFTGKKWTGADKGTSISIGYMTESWVDFGFPLFLLPIFFIGYFQGLFYRYVINQPYGKYFLFAVINSFFLNFKLFETAGIKIWGNLFMTFLSYILFFKYVFPVFYKHMTNKRIPSTTPKNEDSTR